VLRTTSATYTPTGKVATATDANGNITRAAYDAVDRVASVTDPTGSVTTFAYDAMSRQTQTFNPAIQASALVTRGYTPDGLTASLSDAAAHTTTYAYDGLDRLATTTWPGGTTEAYTYDADANPLTKKTRKGDTITHTYDTLNRLATKAPPSSPLVTYSYDLVGHPTGISDTSSAIAAVAATASYAATYSYDALNRPITANWAPAVAQTVPTQSGVTFTHGYDADDRRVSQSASDKDWLLYPAGASSTSYTANSLNQYSAVGAASPTYDGNGNLINDGTLSYGYDPESRLMSVAQGATTLGAYTFDAQGRRKSKTAGGTATIYVTDAGNREVLELMVSAERWSAGMPMDRARTRR
jgi:YD repeat-containing protein